MKKVNKKLLKNDLFEDWSGWDWLGDMKEGTYIPPEYMIFGKKNEGKVPVGGANGIAIMMPYTGGGEGFAPDYETIGLNEDGKLMVKDYISATLVNQYLETKVTLNTVQTITGRKTFSQAIGVGPDAQGVGVIISYGRLTYSPDNGVHKYNINYPAKNGTMAVIEDIPTSFIEDITKSGSTFTAQRKDGTTVSWTEGGGGGGTPTYVIVANMDYQEKTITITSPTYKRAIEDFFNENDYFPNIKLTLNVYASGTLVQTGEYEKNDAQIVLSSGRAKRKTKRRTRRNATILNIWFTKSNVDTEADPQKFNFREIVFTDNGTTMSATFNGFESESFASDKVVNIDGEQTIRGRKTFTAFVDVEYQGQTTQYGKNNIRNNIDENTHYDYTFPNKSGTIAMTSDIPSTTEYETHITSFDCSIGGSTERTHRLEVYYKTVKNTGELSYWEDIWATAVEIYCIKVYNKSTKEAYTTVGADETAVDAITIEATRLGEYITVNAFSGMYLNDVIIQVPKPFTKKGKKIAKKSKKALRRRK